MSGVASLTVLNTGPQLTVQDLGRPGHGSVGVVTGGAADRASLVRANRGVGNSPGAAALEALMGQTCLRADADLTLCLDGAPATVRVDGRPEPFGRAFGVAAGATVEIAAPVCGLRTYLAVRGGVLAPTILGSAAASPSVGLGRALRAGDVLAVGSSRTATTAALAGPAAAGVDTTASPAQVARLGPIRVRVVLGPRDDWFTASALRALVRESWSVSAELDRVGMRLDGPALTRARTDELPSEGMVRGAVQVPADGRPVIFLADHPGTGGYPVIAVVVDGDVDALAQARPGEQIWFEQVDPPALGR